MFWFIVTVGFFLYFLLDVNYFVRCAVTYIVGNYLRKRIVFGESSTTYGVCLPNDADFMLTHMNNGRYIREYDFGRFDYLARTGLMDEFLAKKANFPVAACIHRYRQPLWMFSPYKIITTPVYWESKALYLDQRIVTLADNMVRTVGYVKIAVVGLDFEETLKKFFPSVKKPEIPKDLVKMIEWTEMSSEMMKKSK